VSLSSPLTAPARTDLPFLRHRRRPPSAPAAPVSAASSPALPEFLHGTSSRHQRPATPDPKHPAERSPLDLSAPAPRDTPSQGASLDLSAPGPGASLDLSAPGPGASLDLSAPSPGASLDLSAPAPSRAAGATPPAVRTYAPPRAQAGAATILTAKAPTITLTRVQSGVGALQIELACSAEVGDARLGCAYQLRSGLSSVVQHASGVPTAPPGSRRPVLTGLRDEFEELLVDLVQVRELDRFVVYAFSASDSELTWGGTLVVSTLGQARVELPMDGPASAGVLVLLSVFNVAGELVLRNESDGIAGTVRDACVAYGFDRIAWLDARTPLV